MRWVLWMMFIFFNLLSACNNSITDNSKLPAGNLKNISLSNETGKVETNTPNNEKLFDVNESKSKYPVIWFGNVSVTNGIINSDNIWSLDEEFVDKPRNFINSDNYVWSLQERDNDREKPLNPSIDKDTFVKVDIMTCHGYLGSGKISYKTKSDNQAEWKLTFDPETIAADAIEKVRQCNELNSKNTDISAQAFAVAPQKSSRKIIKINQVNTHKLFISLPIEVQKWLKNKYGSDTHKKNNLSLTGDYWTDIDGDGKIDLIYIFTEYDEEHSGGVIMLLVNSKWKPIGIVQD